MGNRTKRRGPYSLAVLPPCSFVPNVECNESPDTGSADHPWTWSWTDYNAAGANATKTVTYDPSNPQAGLVIHHLQP